MPHIGTRERQQSEVGVASLIGVSCAPKAPLPTWRAAGTSAFTPRFAKVLRLLPCDGFRAHRRRSTIVSCGSFSLASLKCRSHVVSCYSTHIYDDYNIQPKAVGRTLLHAFTLHFAC